jgi:hypothetical protein
MGRLLDGLTGLPVTGYEVEGVVERGAIGYFQPLHDWADVSLGRFYL